MLFDPVVLLEAVSQAPAPMPADSPPPVSLQSHVDAQSNQLSVGGVGSLQSLSNGSGEVSVSLDGGRGDNASPADAIVPTVGGPSWIGGKVGVKSSLTLGALGAVDVNVSHVLHQEVVDDGHYVLAQTFKGDSVASAAMTLPDLGPVSNKVGGETNIDAAASRPSSVAASEVRTDLYRSRLYYTGTMKPLPQLSIETGVSLISQSADSDVEGASHEVRSTAFSPKLVAVYTPWTDAKWSVAVERHVDPLSVNDFVAAVSNRSQEERFDLTFQPNADLRYHAAVSQGFPGGATASLMATQSRDGMTLEQVMLSPSLQSPNSVKLDSAEHVDLSLKAPLEFAGLTGAVLETSAGWSRSMVIDPLTQERRGLSGEQPLQIRIGLEQTLPSTPVSWGVHTAAGGQRTYYGDGSTLTVDAPPTWDAFLQYRPGPVLVRFQISGVAGTPSLLTEGRASALVQQGPYAAFGGGVQNTAPQVSLLLKTAL
jgi:hypothetical protein